MANRKSSAVPSKGEDINHFAAIRLRVVGSGNLIIRTYGLEEVLIQQLVNTPMVSATNIQPTKLMNVSQQRLSFEFRVTEFGEWFELQRFIIFSKPIYTQQPNL